MVCELAETHYGMNSTGTGDAASQGKLERLGSM